VLAVWMIWVWNVAILLVGVGFFYQDQPWAASLFAPGYTALIALWLYQLTQAVRLRRGRPTAGAEVTTDAGS
jgi:cytochrome c oxidase cbb3-type subunit 1